MWFLINLWYLNVQYQKCPQQFKSILFAPLCTLQKYYKQHFKGSATIHIQQAYSRPPRVLKAHWGKKYCQFESGNAHFDVTLRFFSFSVFMLSAFQRIEFPYYFLSWPKCSHHSLFSTGRNMCWAWSKQNLSFWFWSPGLSNTLNSLQHIYLLKSADNVIIS